MRTVVIDPGHGGDDAGAKGPNGTLEKDVTLQLARRLKAAIESRVGLRVLLTRDADENVPVDRRTALANNNKADVLFSLHANASVRPALHGAQVLSLSLDDYKSRARELIPGTPVPVAGGGTRLVGAVPWDLAQIPHAGQSASLAAIVERHLAERHVPCTRARSSRRRCASSSARTCPRSSSNSASSRMPRTSTRSPGPTCRPPSSRRYCRPSSRSGRGFRPAGAR